MTGVVAIDASAALRAVLDASSQPALIERIATASWIVAPSLLQTEVANALWKYRRAGLLDDLRVVERHAEAVGLVDRFTDDAVLFPEALRLAVTSDHPVYDAMYLVAARRHAACLLTFDRRLHAQCARSQVDGVLFGG